MSSHDFLKLQGLKEHNLKSVNVEVAHNKVTVVCGPSGSGKSTLAFDALYAEGARRYVETFDPYTRQFLDRLKAPEASSIENVRPGLALEQRNRITSSRSTVGTVTEINDYLKILWAQASVLECPSCNQQIKPYSPEMIVKLLANIEGHNLKFYLTFKINIKKASLRSFTETLKAAGFSRLLSKRSFKIIKLEEVSERDIEKQDLYVVVDRISLKSATEIAQNRQTKSRFLTSLTQSYEFGKNDLSVFVHEDDAHSLQELAFSNRFYCSRCDRSFKQATPALFTYNSPIGACNECQGFGKVLKIDPLKCIPDPSLTLSRGAVNCLEGVLGKKEKSLMLGFCRENDIPLNVAWENLPDKSRRLLLEGPQDRKKGFKGILPWFDVVGQRRHKMHVRIFIAKHRSEFLCPKCKGSRLVEDSLLYKVANKNVYEISNLPFDQLLPFIEKISLTEELSLVKKEIVGRLKYLQEVGLPYLTLDRQTKTLSGGEFQRVNLTTLLGANLVNSLFVLDEPTIGLHSRDTKLLIAAIRELSKRGNSLVVVEHDPEVIADADNIIELGPDSGSGGGEIVFCGTPQTLLNADTKTSRYFKNLSTFEGIKSKRKVTASSDKLSITKASANNLKNLSVDLPLKNFVVLGGVSGSGKSSLLHDCLFRAYQEQGVKKKILTSYVEISGLSEVKEVILIDQQPIGKSSRANSATYTKVWDNFREYFAETELAISLGLSKSAFSFNVEGGRCPVCKGNGSLKIEMQFLTDVEIECEACLGKRFGDQVLSVSLGGKNVMEVLEMPIADIPSYLEALPNERRNAGIILGLKPLLNLGMGYVTLGQSLSSLSGGEAQRLKLASYLGKKSTNNLFILDEPTTGLHPSDILVLLSAIQSLVTAGNSVICIEHNLDVIKEADWFVELGPEGGEGGGRLILEGEPENLIADRTLKSPTLISLREEFKISAPKRASKVKKEPQLIKIRGAKEHNLKNVSLDIPVNKLIVVTGLSGSGKSTLAFDILFSEGQRRFIDCLSPYARQYISQVQKPDVDSLEGLPPTVAVSQKIAPPSGISTLGTVTEVYQYLRLLFSKVGIQHCVDDHSIISNFSQDFIVDEIINKHTSKIVHIFAPVVMGRKGHYRDLFERAIRAELTNARIDGDYKKISDDLKLERHKLHWISLEVGKLKVTSKNRAILSHAISQAIVMAQGSVEVSIDSPFNDPIIFNLDRICPQCKRGYLPLDPQDFSFRSLRGMCKTCSGRGEIELAGLRAFKECPECQGARVGEIGRNVKINGKTIFELTALKPKQLREFFLSWNYPDRLAPVVKPLLKELMALLEMIDEVGLGYLTLNRDASTLSGGEGQRLRLAKNLGAPLTGVCYVLDEPSIGLHASDHGRLMETLKRIRDQGNTVVVVEHDEDTIIEADHVIDIGPHAGVRGGNIVFSGEFADLLECESSKTAQAFNERKSNFKRRSFPSIDTSSSFVLKGAHANNLKSIDVRFPLKGLISVVGVSGAGKSSLIYGSLVPAVLEQFEGANERAKFYDKTWESMDEIANLNRMIEIDQKPIGKTPSSTPASFLGLFTEIRKLFETLPEAKIRGYSAAHFSYNTGKGKCQICEGRGYIKIPMSFLPDARSECEACNAYRYNDETLEVKYNGYSIGDILKLTITEATEVLKHFSKIKSILDSACDLGIGYLSLGQASHTLSGGEAQRLKIVREIAAKETGSCLYLLDEPTIGLHMLDVRRLINVMRKLVEKGNTVIVIEHNFDVLLNSDYVIDLGPGPGDQGGSLLFEGTTSEYIKSRHKSPTKLELKKYLSSLKSVPSIKKN